MQTLRSIEELNWALTIYTDIVKFGDRSQLIQESEDCVKVLEDFEEYEKCSVILAAKNKIVEALKTKQNI